MTVEENLRFCASTRLPSAWSGDKKVSAGSIPSAHSDIVTFTHHRRWHHHHLYHQMQFVDACEGLLSLREIKHSKIGDERKRGISGGQRKRVNIGMEMVADPTVLCTFACLCAMGDVNSQLTLTTCFRVCFACAQTVLGTLYCCSPALGLVAAHVCPHHSPLNATL